MNGFDKVCYCLSANNYQLRLAIFFLLRKDLAAVLFSLKYAPYRECSQRVNDFKPKENK